MSSTLFRTGTMLVILVAALNICAYSQVPEDISKRAARSRSAASSLERGNTLFTKGNVAEAISQYNEAIKADPTFVAAYYCRSLAREHLKDFDGASTDLSIAIKLAPGIAELYNERGYVRMVSGDKDGAIEDYDKAISLKSYEALFFYNRGVAYSEKGDQDHAYSDIDKAILLNGSFENAYVRRGILRERQKDVD
jgi:tetratricopeptide (TPR) repeat protein